MQANRIGLGITLALHTLAVAALISYEPARKALLAAAPIMVSIFSPTKVEQPKPVPPTQLPKPKPIAKRVEQPVEAPVLSAAAEAPSPAGVAPPPPSAPAPAVQAAPAFVTQPIYNADYLHNPAPTYPSVSRRAGEQGRVILRVLVGESGGAEEVQLRSSSGFPRLDDAARETVQRWKFVPAKRGSEPIAAWVLIPVSFRLER